MYICLCIVIKILKKKFILGIDKRKIIIYNLCKTLKRRVESYSIGTETFRLVREMREKLLNMALESSHRDLFRFRL